MWETLTLDKLPAECTGDSRVPAGGWGDPSGDIMSRSLCKILVKTGCMRTSILLKNINHEIWKALRMAWVFALKEKKSLLGISFSFLVVLKKSANNLHLLLHLRYTISHIDHLEHCTAQQFNVVETSANIDNQVVQHLQKIESLFNHTISSRHH